MGRLLRKRVTVQKKKKPTENDETSAGRGEAGASPAASQGAAAVAVERKADGAGSSKLFALPKPAVARLESGRIGQVVQFLREVKLELRKVIWPSRKQAIGSTTVVIVLVMIISLFLGVIDIGLSTLITAILQ
jgi:preprotein translocase subunit SecE